MKVWIVISLSGIHGVKDSYLKAQILKIKTDYDLGMSGALYESRIVTEVVK